MMWEGGNHNWQGLDDHASSFHSPLTEQQDFGFSGWQSSWATSGTSGVELQQQQQQQQQHQQHIESSEATWDQSKVNGRSTFGLNASWGAPPGFGQGQADDGFANYGIAQRQQQQQQQQPPKQQLRHPQGGASGLGNHPGTLFASVPSDRSSTTFNMFDESQDVKMVGLKLKEDEDEEDDLVEAAVTASLGLSSSKKPSTDVKQEMEALRIKLIKRKQKLQQQKLALSSLDKKTEIMKQELGYDVDEELSRLQGKYAQIDLEGDNKGVDIDEMYSKAIQHTGGGEKRSKEHQQSLPSIPSPSSTAPTPSYINSNIFTAPVSAPIPAPTGAVLPAPMVGTNPAASEWYPKTQVSASPQQLPPPSSSAFIGAPTSSTGGFHSSFAGDVHQSPSLVPSSTPSMGTMKQQQQQRSNMGRSHDQFSTMSPSVSAQISSKSGGASGTVNDGTSVASSSTYIDEAQRNEVIAAVKTVQGSQKIQKSLQRLSKLSRTHPEYQQLMQHALEVFKSLQGSLGKLLSHRSANYAVSKLFEVLDNSNRTAFLTEIESRLARICRHQHGTFAVQKIISAISDPEQISILVNGFKFEVRALALDTHATFTLQKLLSVSLGAGSKSSLIRAFLVGNSLAGSTPAEMVTVTPDDCDFIKQVALSKHGAMFLTALLRNCSEEDLQLTIRILLPNTLSIACDMYGNYVIQLALEKSVKRSVTSSKMMQDATQLLEGLISSSALFSAATNEYGVKVLLSSLSMDSWVRVRVSQRIFGLNNETNEADVNWSVTDNLMFHPESSTLLKRSLRLEESVNQRKRYIDILNEQLRRLRHRHADTHDYDKWINFLQRF